VKSRSADRTLQRIAKGDLSSQPQAKGRADVDAAAADLGPAIERGQLALHYQPIVELRTGRPVRVEALVRWTHARFGLIDPRDLVRLAEVTGLTQRVSTWAVREAARQRGVWLKAGLDLGITLNLVGPELRGSGPDELLAGIRTLFPSPNAFTFEVPSAVFARGEEWMRQGVSALSLAGARVSIDQVSPADAPARSRSVDIDELKIARAVVLRAVADPAAAMTLRRLVQGARDLGLATVAVGVEDEATFRLVTSLGCDLGQGFWMSRPVAAPEVAPFHSWLARALLGGTTAAVAFAGMAKVALAAQAAPEVSHSDTTAGATAPGGGDTCCSLKTDLVRDVGLAMHDVLLDRATLHLESSVSEGDATRIADAVTRDVAASEKSVGASFEKAPQVYVFATRNSFSFALQRGFGQRATDAAALATANGGVAFPGQNAIVVNWENVRGDTNVAIVRHELTHVLIHQLAGVNTELPAWFDEGVATLAERQVAPDAARDARDASATMNLVRSGQTSLQELSASRDWTMRNATLDGRAYTFAAAGVSVLQESLGPGGLQKLLARAHDVGFATAFGEATGGSTSDFSLSFPARLAAHQTGVQIAQTPAGDKVRWIVSGATPSANLKINIAGNGYHLDFEAIADRDGAYTAIFGGTAPAGDYTITVLGGGGSASAVVHIG
jgi:EAL domain-containing protein (putative c-di-GMP-specific phosphodiesterase class I)